MKKFFDLFKQSNSELKSVKVIVLTALLLALNIVIAMYAIIIPPKVSWDFFTLETIGMLFGPAVAGIAGLLSDLIGYIVKPSGPFFPGFTITAILTGIIYGLFFYKQKITIPRIILAKTVKIVVINIILYPVFLSMLYGWGYVITSIPMRIIVYLIALPTEILLFIPVAKIVEREYKKLKGS